MNLKCRLALLAFNASVLCWGAEPATNRISPPAAVETTSVLPGFYVEEGFRIEMVANDSVVSSPAAMAFDENGRLFVAEMRDYPNLREQNPHLGRIRLLEDSNADGRFDRSTIFADNLAWPSAVACSQGGIFVGATPEILFLKDTSGSGQADVRRVIYTGIGAGKPLRVDTLVNSFSWGPDNRIHVGTAGLGGTLTGVEVGGGVSLELGQNDFAFDPRTFAVVVDSGTAQTGMCFDDFGRRYFSELARPLRTAAYAVRYTARNPFFPRARETIEVMNPAPVFRAVSAETDLEPGQPRLSAPAGAPPDFGPLTTDWTRLARGCIVYRGSLFPPAYLGNVFVAEPKAGVIHRALLRDIGTTTTAIRAPNEVTSEFLISRDPLFHPSQIVLGPDGALYVADMRDGGDHGRIYRIAPSGFRPGRLPALQKVRSADLLPLLGQTNGWMRDTAARLLYERRDPASMALLTNMVMSARNPAARVQAMRMLEGFGALNEPAVLRALRDPDERVREPALRLSETFMKGGVVSDLIRGQLKTMAGDSSPRVRQQLAFTAGELPARDRVAILAQLVRRDSANPIIETAVFSSLSHGAGELFVNLAGDPRFRDDLPSQDLLRRLLTMMGVQGQQDEVAVAVDFIDRNALVDRPTLETRLAFSFLFALGDGLRRNRSSLALVDRQGRLQRFFDQAVAGAADDTLAATVRVDAIRLLGVGNYTYGDVGDLLQLLYGTDQPAAVQSAGLTALARLDDARISTNLFARMQFMTPVLRREAVTAVMGRAGGAAAVLGALDTGQIRPADLSPVQINFLRTHRDPQVSGHALRLFGPFVRQRPGILEQAKPAIRTAGAPARGKPIFTTKCALCHRLGTDGREVGPDLGAAKVRGKDKLLEDILSPSQEIDPRYTVYVAETGTLDTLIGIQTDQAPSTVTFGYPDGTQAVWPRATLQILSPQPWSIMPDGLETGLNLQGLADLLEYLATNPR